MAKKVALAIGATGIIGRSFIRHVDKLDDWEVIALSRRPPDWPTRARHVAADLSDPADAKAKLGELKDVTHVFYSAYVDGPTWAAQAGPNAALLRNALDGLEPAAKGLKHVCLLQGTKYYGHHLGAYKTPAKENDPRHMPPNFYFDQQDLLIERSRGKAWSWSALRPHTVIGYAVGNPLNLLSGLAVYAAISKELGLPLRFPGTRECYSRIMQATDSGLLARSMAWAATTPACAGQAYNITNGDFFRWENLWPKLARAFDMPVGPVQTIDLAVMMADKAPLWDAMVKKYDLRKISYQDAANWRFMNYAFRVDWDAMSDTLKCRRDGFLEFMDSEAMYLRLIEKLRAERFIP